MATQRLPDRIDVTFTGEDARIIERYAEIYDLTRSQAAAELIGIAVDGLNEPLSDRDAEPKAQPGAEPGEPSQRWKEITQ